MTEASHVTLWAVILLSKFFASLYGVNFTTAVSSIIVQLQRSVREKRWRQR
jgi:hypothetical protein